MTTTFDHRSIGPIKAKVTSPQIVQFLGLQYATISDRFAKAAPKHYAKGTEVDATKLGLALILPVVNPLRAQS